MVRPDKWWDQRESVVRRTHKKRYKTAYKISSEHVYRPVHPLLKQNGYLDG